MFHVIKILPYTTNICILITAVGNNLDPLYLLTISVPVADPARGITHWTIRYLIYTSADNRLVNKCINY